MATSVDSLTRRKVRGLAYRVCDFCGRSRTDRDGNVSNYQYINEQTGGWEQGIYCSKICRNAWRGMNGGR